MESENKIKISPRKQKILNCLEFEKRYLALSDVASVLQLHIESISADVKALERDGLVKTVVFQTGKIRTKFVGLPAFPVPTPPQKTAGKMGSKLGDKSTKTDLPNNGEMDSEIGEHDFDDLMDDAKQISAPNQFRDTLTEFIRNKLKARLESEYSKWGRPQNRNVQEDIDMLWKYFELGDFPAIRIKQLDAQKKQHPTQEEQK